MSIDRLTQWATASPWPAAGLLVALAATCALIARRAGGYVLAAGIGALVCTGFSADTSWRFADHRLHMATRERLWLFAAGEIVLIVCAVMARANKQATATDRQAGTPGVPGVMVWCIASVQIVPAFTESGLAGGLVRAVFGPVMAALLWHLAMGLEIRVTRPEALSTGLPALIGRELRERLLSYLGLATRDRTAEQITRDRATARAVRLASRPKLRSWGQRRLAAAVARARVGTDGEQRHRLLQELAARRTSGELATVPLPSPWASTGVLAEPYPRTPLGVTGAQLRSMDPFEAVLQVHAAHPQLTAAELAATCTEYGVPVTETQVRIALRARSSEAELAVLAPLALTATPALRDVPEPAVPDGEYTASGLHLDLVTEPEVRPEFACAVPAVAAAQTRTRAEVHARVPDVPAGFADGVDRVLDEIAKDRAPRADRSRTRPRVRPVPTRQKKAAAAAANPADQLARARELDAEHRRTHGRPASIRALKTGLRVGQPRAEQLRALLDEGAQS
jgi:hypothetical protein